MTLKIKTIEQPAIVENTTQNYSVTIPQPTTVVLPDEQIQVLDEDLSVIGTDTKPVYDEKVINMTSFRPEEKLDFIFTVDTTLNGSFSLNADTLNNFLVYWGDGSSDYVNGNSIIHQYTTSGIYDITIRGSFDNSSIIDKQKATTIKQWGKCGLATYNSSFRGFSSIGNNYPQNETLCLMGDCQKVFKGQSGSNYGKLSTSMVTSFRESFDGSNFNYNVADWNVARVTNGQNCFRGTSMSQANCDAIFTGWTRWDSATGTAGLTLKSNVSLHMGNTDYTRGGDAEAAFNYLVNTLNWTIIFG